MDPHLTNTLLASAASLDVIGIVIGMLGGLALFLYGMHKMSDGLKAVAGEGMKTLLSKLTKNRFMAAVTGALVTAILQSSSITTVLVVGFVSAGLMTLAQTVGVIMGANVGTTITAQMLAFDITDFAWLMVALGFVAWSFGRRDFMRNLGAMLMGFGMLFIGMGQMGEATSPLRTHQPFIDLMGQMDHVLLGMLVGAGFTALVQSSSATIGIVIMLASQGHISLGAGIALGIGSKVGTCVTAVLSGMGKPAEARRVGVVHVLFNVLGALMWLPFIDHLATMAVSVSPVHPELQGVERLAEETPRQVANAITIFAAVNLSVMIWFTSPIARLAEFLVRDRSEPESESDRASPKFLDPVFFQTPSLAIDQVRLELTHLGDCIGRMWEKVPPVVMDGSEQDLDELVAMGSDVDKLHIEILNYIAVLAREELSSSETRQVECEIEIANNLAAITELIGTNFVARGRRRLEGQVEFSAGTRSSYRRLREEVEQSMRDVLRAVAENDLQLAQSVVDRKAAVTEFANTATEGFARDLLREGAGRVVPFRIGTDFVDQIQRLFYHVRRIAKAVLMS